MRKDRRAIALMLAFGMAFWAIPFQSVSGATESKIPKFSVKSDSKSASSKKDTLKSVPNQVVVQYKEGAVTTEEMTAKEKSRAGKARVAKSFGTAMQEKTSIGTTRAKNTLGQQAKILESALSGNYEIQDTVAFDSKAGSKDDEVISVIESDEYSTDTLVKKLSSNPNVEKAEPNYIFQASGLQEDTGWNDEYLNTSWQLGKQGILATEGWKAYDSTKEKSSDDVVVAVIDTGIDYNHEELKNHMWKAPKGFKLTGTYGHDFVQEEGDLLSALLGIEAPEDPDGIDPMDQNGHGTHCAGIIAAQANNGSGIAGVFGGDKTSDTPGIKLMGVRVLDSNGSGSFSDVIKGFYYVTRARKLGVNVRAVNCSLGGAVDSSIFDSVIDQAGAAGIVTVTAAGNDALDNDAEQNAPSNSVSDYNVAVAASDEDGTLASYSNYGKNNVDVVAPGSNILSSVCYDNYVPWLYSADQLKKNTEFFGKFTTDSKKSDDTYVPVSGKDRNGTDITGMKEFGGAETAAYHVDGSKGKSELSLCSSDNGTMSASGNDTSLQWKIKDAKAGDTFVLYFPYSPGGSGVNNARHENIAYNTVTQEGTMGALVTGDMNVAVGDDGEMEEVNLAEDRSDSAELVSDTLNSVWRTDGFQSSALKFADSQKFGFGIAYQAVTDGDVTISIDSMGISKKNADEDSFGKYALESGTSMATPVVTGSVALIAAMNPKADAKQLRSILFQTTDNKYKNDVSTGGGIDFSEYSVDNVSAKPALRTVTVNRKNNTVTLEGAAFGTSPKVTAVNPVQKTRQEIASKDVTVSGNSITIRNASSYHLAGSQITFTVDNGTKSGQGTFYLVKGESKYKSEFTLTGDEVNEGAEDETRKKSGKITADDDDTEGDEEGESEYEMEWIPNPTKLVGYSSDSGDLYTVSKKGYELVGEELEDSIQKYATKQAKKKSLWKLEKGESLSITPITNAAYMHGMVYEVVSCDLGDRVSYLLVGKKISGENPKWTVYSDTLSDSGNMPATISTDTPMTASLVGLNGTLYLAGGAEKTEKGITPVTDTWLCTPKSGATWRKGGSLPSGLYGGRTVSGNGKVYYVMGRDKSGVNYNVMAYNGKSWTKAGTLPTALNEDLNQDEYKNSQLSCAVGTDGKGILFGGISTDGMGDTFRFNWKTGKCEALGYTFWGKLQEVGSRGATVGGKFYVENQIYDEDGLSADEFKSISVANAYRTFKVKKSGKGSGSVGGVTGIQNGEKTTVTITPSKGSYIYSYSIKGYGIKKSYKAPKAASKKAAKRTLTATKDATIQVHFGKICTKVKMNKKSLKLKRGKSYKLKASANGTNSKVTWKVSNKRLASVSKKGRVTIKKSARKGQKVKVIARSKENRKLKAICVIRIK